MVWELRTTGSDTNGGAFKAGATGSDWSTQDAAQYSVADGVTAGSTTITSATAAFGTDVVGNVMYVQGGTGSVTAGWYEITVRNSATSVTVDRSTGLTAGTGVTLKIGGALATINTLATLMVTSNKAFVKASAGYTTTATIAFTGGGFPSTSIPPTRLIGYTTTRGDAGRATLTLSTTSSLTGLSFSTQGWWVENIVVDCASLTSSTGIANSGGTCRIRNCKVSNFKVYGVNLSGVNSQVSGCEVTGGLSGATAAILVPASSDVVRCYIHDNVCTGVTAGNFVTGWSARLNLLANNTGASSDGIQITSGAHVHRNTVYGSGRHGIAGTDTTSVRGATVTDNILVNNGGYGLQLDTGAGSPAYQDWDGNAYYNNTSGTRNFADDTTTNKVNGVAPYTNVLDVILTGDPFTNAAGGDFSLNNTAGAGAACRAAGLPGTWPGASTTGYPDLGAVQHADPTKVQYRPSLSGNV